MGISGIALVFGAELAQTTLSSGVFRGAALAVFGAATVAVGNVMLAGAAATEIGMLRVNAYGFAVGTIAILAWGVASGAPWSLEITPTWLAGFAYLLLVGSVLALAIYIKILAKIGYVAGAYVVVLSPVIALVISSLFEGFELGLMTALGVGLLLAGHSLLIVRGRK
jgi:drug/metabolite transporter (DMT)-like permease